MEDKRRVMEIFSFYDRSGLERRLAAMAEKGWLLEKIGSTLWTYRRTEPRKPTFCVCWFPKASAFDPEPSEEQQTFYDFCEHTGWTLAASYGQMQVFYNDRPDPVPIETDPVMEVDAIHRAAKRTTLPSHLVLLALALLNGGLFISRLLGDPVGLLASATNLFTGVDWVVLIVLEAVECGSYFLWHRRAVKAAEQGEFLEAKNHRTFQIVCLAVVGIGLLYYLASILTSGNPMMMVIALLMFGVYLPGVFLLTRGMMAFLKKRKVSTGVNRTVTLLSAFVGAFLLVGGITWGVLFGSTRGWFAGSEETYEYHGNIFTAPQDKLPLTVEDLLDVDYDGYIREQTNQQSLLLAQYEARQRPRFDAADFREMPTLEYTVTLVKAPFLYDMCRDHLLLDRAERWNRDMPEIAWYSYEPADPAPWGAEAAYCWTSRGYGPRNTYLLCYPDRFVEIDFSYGWQVTPEQMTLVAERLGNIDDGYSLQK